MPSATTKLQVALRQLARESLSAVRRPVTTRQFQQAVAASTEPVRIVAGSGARTIPGWINTDVGWKTRHYLDLTQPWPIPSGSVARVYLDNVIEHFTLDDGRDVLRHLLAALEPGGRVRFATPDVERTARAYLDDPDLTSRHLERHRGRGYQAVHPVDLLNITWVVGMHYEGYCYDLAALAAELDAAGFTDIHREEAGESADPAFAGLESRASDTERATQLVVEAARPV